jgi:hypothetical protein
MPYSLFLKTTQKGSPVGRSNLYFASEMIRDPKCKKKEMKVMLLIITSLLISWNLIAQTLSGTYTIGSSSPNFLNRGDAVSMLETNGEWSLFLSNKRPGIWSNLKNNAT